MVLRVVLRGYYTTHTQPSHQPESQLVQISEPGTHGVISGYSKGTHGVRSGYSRGTVWGLY